MERNNIRAALVNLAVLLALGLVGFGAARYAHSLTGQVAALFFALGVLSAAVTLFQMRLEEQERIERLELDELSRGPATGALFEGQEADTRPAQRAREQFERFFVPGFTLALLVLTAVASWRLWKWLQTSQPEPAREPLVTLGIFGLAGLALFLVGKYSAGLVRLEKQRLLGPSASYLLLGSYLYFLVFLVIGIGWAAGLPQLDAIAARVLCVLLALLAAEALLTLVLEIYRPRVKGRAGRILYESRLIGLLSHPEGLVTTAAHALDYQFGFKVSDTWLYRFMEKALAWLVLAQLALLLVSTSFVFVQAGEEALLERFGKPVANRETLGPGLHFKFPWPIDKIHRFRTWEVQVLHVGAEHEDEHAAEEQRHEVILWTVSHAEKEFHLMVAGREEASASAGEAGRKAPPVSLLSARIPVHFQVQDLKSYAYRFADAHGLLEQLATREVVRYMVSADYQEITSNGRGAAAEELRGRIQARADEHGLGVRVLFVGLADIHPPVGVAQAYEAVVGARQKKEANLREAQAHRIRTNSLARAEALRIRRQAEARRQNIEQNALARAAYFTNQQAAFASSPSVYMQRAYLHTLERGARDARKIVVGATNVQNVIQLNLEEKLQMDMRDLTIPSSTR